MLLDLVLERGGARVLARVDSLGHAAPHGQRLVRELLFRRWQDLGSNVQGIDVDDCVMGFRRMGALIRGEISSYKQTIDNT